MSVTPELEMKKSLQSVIAKILVDGKPVRDLTSMLQILQLSQLGQSPKRGL